ncbi:hypothetical protein SO802_018016 [Lithocarpus litseifolius]|uniref:Beta-galactosidase n=1 Tax=Lithocarpus litseifolius TaxID=425828 RepID=A0AAW2CKV4_9ROSI
MEWWWRLCWGLVVVIMMESGGHAEGGEVTYDGRSLIIDGKRQMLFSGSIHYPRSTPEVCVPNVKGTRPTTFATTIGNESHQKRHRLFSSSFVGSVGVQPLSAHPLWNPRMADHDRRREAIKRQRSQAREELHVNQDLGTRGNHEMVFGEINEGEVGGDLASVFKDLSHTNSPCTAKAA